MLNAIKVDYTLMDTCLTAFPILPDKRGMTQEILAVLFNKDDSEPTGLEAKDYGTGREGY